MELINIEIKNDKQMQITGKSISLVCLSYWTYWRMQMCSMVWGMFEYVLITYYY